MIDVNEYLNNHQNEIKNIISSFDEKCTFSSHDFIEKFSQNHESDYIGMLIKYKKSGFAFRTVHSIIALYLSNNMDFFHIEKTSKIKSENVHGNLSIIQWWKRKATHNNIHKK